MKIKIDKVWLFEQYVVSEKSSTEIAKIVNCSAVTILARLKEHNISLRSASERKQGRLNPSYGKRGESSPRFGCHHSAQSKQKIKDSVPRGPDHFRWKHPKARLEPLNNQIRNCYKNKEWKFAVLKRDNFTCQICKRSGLKLEVDHIKPFSVIRNEHSVQTLDEALCCKELWDINNGRALCVECHKLTPTHGYKIKFYG